MNRFKEELGEITTPIVISALAAGTIAIGASFSPKQPAKPAERNIYCYANRPDAWESTSDSSRIQAAGQNYQLNFGSAKALSAGTVYCPGGIKLSELKTVDFRAVVGGVGGTCKLGEVFVETQAQTVAFYAGVICTSGEVPPLIPAGPASA